MVVVLSLIRRATSISIGNPTSTSSTIRSFGSTAFVSTSTRTTRTTTSRYIPIGCLNPRRAGSQLSESTWSTNRIAHATRLYSTPTQDDSVDPNPLSDDVPLYLAEGLFAVNKPLEWTSSDVVSFIRGILERDTKQRGGTVSSVRSRKNKSRKLKVGHGGTLDPLATGVLVIGVGSGTKKLQSYLSGSKRYTAQAKLGFETTTLDMDPQGTIAKTAPFEHITISSIQEVLPEFRGTIKQIPPVFSAIKKGGKKLYEGARQGMTAEDLKVEPREVEVYGLELIDPDDNKLPCFDIDLECGGGTYVRSLLRDIAYRLDSVATTTLLMRTKQGQFTLDDALDKVNWNPDSIYAAIEKFQRENMEPTEEE